MLPDQKSIALLICPVRVTRHVYTTKAQKDLHPNINKQQSLKNSSVYTGLYLGNIC